VFTPAARAEWRPHQKLVVLYGQNDAGQETDGVAVPLKTLQTLAVYARRYTPADEPEGTVGAAPFHLEHVLVRRADVGMIPTDPQRMSLMIDRGLDTEIGFALTLSEARDLGQQLIELAALLGAEPRVKN
jgi:hypothetical protein